MKKNRKKSQENSADKPKAAEKEYFLKYSRMIKKSGKYNSDKVILIRLDLIGDCTMFTDAAYTVRKHFKNREMTVVCLSVARPVFERMGVFDNIYTVDFKPRDINYEKLDLLIEQLREEEYDILLQPQVSKCPITDILVAAVKCNTRISMEAKSDNSSDSWVKMTNSIYDKLIPYPEGVVSEFDYYGAFVRGLGIDYKTRCPRLKYGKQNFIEVKYFVIYPGGSFRQKFWDPSKLAKLVEHIYARTGLVCVILGVESEKWISDAVKKKLDVITAMDVADLTGYTTISDVIDIIGNAQFVVTNDTSGVHIACATRTPSVVIVGGWHYNRFLPYHIEDVRPEDKLPMVANTPMPCYNCEWTWSIIGKRNPECLKRMQCEKTSECIDKISYSQVQKLVDELIEKEKLC